jgi:hypothetical protein
LRATACLIAFSNSGCRIKCETSALSNLFFKIFCFFFFLQGSICRSTSSSDRGNRVSSLFRYSSGHQPSSSVSRRLRRRTRVLSAVRKKRRHQSCSSFLGTCWRSSFFRNASESRDRSAQGTLVDRLELP